MSQPSRPRNRLAPSPGLGARRRHVWLAALVSVSACARFGFERLDSSDAGGSLAGPGWNGFGPGTGGGGGSSGDGATAGAAAIAGEGGRGPSGSGAAGDGAAGDATGTPSAGAEGESARGDAGTGVACSDGARNGDQVGIDCGDSGCSPCVCSLDAPERLSDPNSAGNDLWSPRLSRDGLSLYFAVTVPGTGEQIGVATRPNRASAFGLGQALPGPIDTGKEGTPFISLDERSLYFYSERAGGAGARDLYVATRSGGTDTFDGVTPLASLNTGQLDYLPWLDDGELTIYFVSGPAGGGDIYRAGRASRGDAFGVPDAVTELNSSSDEGGMTLSSDGREIIFSSNRAGGAGGRDLYRATRAPGSDTFASPELLAVLDSADNEIDPAFSPDGRELYFASNRDGDSALYRAARRCGR